MAVKGQSLQQNNVIRTLTVTGGGFYALVTLISVVIGFALYTWVKQLTSGLTVTGLNSSVYWGLYIVNFVFFIGLSAGGMVVAATVHALNLEKFRPVARIAEVLSIISLILATIAILFSMGRPDRLLHLFIFSRPGSPLMWDVIIIFSYLALAITMLYFSLRADLVKLMEQLPSRRGLYKFFCLGYMDLSRQAINRDKKILIVLSIISIPTAVALSSVSAWILGLVKATPGWHSALMAPLFVGSALASGVAMVIMVAALCRRFFKMDISSDTIYSLGKLLFLLTPVLGYLLFSEFITVVFARELPLTATIDQMIRGSYAPVFWFDLIAGLIVPFTILAITRFRSVTWIGVSAALIFLGVLAERIYIVVVPQMAKASLPYPMGNYSPTWVEISMVLGIYALGTLAFIILVKLFPMIELASKKE